MLYGAIDIHKHAFQAAVLDPDSGEVVEERFAADRESLARWRRRSSTARTDGRRPRPSIEVHHGRATDLRAESHPCRLL